ATRLAAGVVAVFMGAAPAWAESFELTAAQRLLFDSDHLRGLANDTTLHYRFVKGGTREPGFTDTVDMTVTRVAPDGTKDLTFRFLSEERNVPFDKIEGFHGNPLIMLF